MHPCPFLSCLVPARCVLPIISCRYLSMSVTSRNENHDDLDAFLDSVCENEAVENSTVDNEVDPDDGHPLPNDAVWFPFGVIL